MYRLSLLAALSLCVASSACSTPSPVTPEVAPEGDEPVTAQPPARMGSLECAKLARKLEVRLFSLCDSHRAFGVPEGMNLSTDSASEPVPDYIITLQVSGLGYRTGQGQWFRDSATLDVELDEAVKRYVRQKRLLQQEEVAEYLVIGDTQAPTSLVLDAMRLMAARGYVDVHLGGVRPASLPEEYPPDAVARGESARSIEDDDERQRALQALDDDVSGGCAAVSGAVVEVADYPPDDSCWGLRKHLPEQYQRCDCDPAVDPYVILAAALGAPPAPVVSRLVTFAPGGAAVTLDPDSPWAESREALLAVDGPIAPPW